MTVLYPNLCYSVACYNGNVLYSKTCVRWPLKNRQNKNLYDKWYLNEGRKYCRMLPLEHSAILLTALSDNN